MSNYDINSIESLSFKEGVRRRIQMYLGTSDIEGTYQALKEIINNSTDEAIAGYGTKIEINVSEKSNSVRVRDYGRGCPFGVREDGENVLVSIYSKSHTGGKFSEGVYKNASGLNGVGAKCVCLSSIWFDVFSIRDGKEAHAHFDKGELAKYEEFKSNLPSGTIVEFEPDPEVFKDGEIGYSYKRICEDIKNISYLYNGLTFVITNDDTKETNTYCAKNGIVDFIKDNVTKPLHKNIMHKKVTDGIDTLEIAFQWGDNRETSYVFVNGLQCPEGGTPITGAKTAITRTMNSLIGKDFDGEKIRQNMTYVINCQVANPSFANQTKSKINNASLRTLASNAFTAALKEFAEQYSSEFKVIKDLLIKIDKADAAAERARNAILNHEKKELAEKKKKISMPEKFSDCEKHGQDSMLIICEGQSAAAGLNPARDISHEALYAVRGKIKNLLKHPLEECLENQEVSDIILALGCGINEKYNSKKLNFGKVAIAVDADADGLNIMCLAATLFHTLMPQFILEGRLCWLRAPLYVLRKGDKRVFAYNDSELEQIKPNYVGWEQTRAKGLGELTAHDMELSMMNEKERRLEVLTINDATAVAESMMMLMGPEVAERREFLFDNVDFSRINK